SERRRDLARVVAVVVVDPYTGRLAAELEATAGAGEFRQHALRVCARHVRELERRQGRRSVAPVVLAWNAELERHRLELVAEHVLRRTLEPALEQLPHLGLGRERRVVVELYVR